MAVVHHVTQVSLLPGGQAIAHGRLDIGTYAVGGATLNLANYFLSNGVPTLLCMPEIQAANKGFSLGINISNGELIALKVLVGGSQYDYLTEANAPCELGINVPFIAVGPTY